MVFDPVHRTGLAFVSLAENGERDFCFFRNPSADMTYTAAEVDATAIASCRMFHFGSITLIDPSAKLATMSAVEQARAGGKLISYDPNLRPPLWPSLSIAQETILEAARWTDMVKVSEDELSFLFSESAQFGTDPPLEADIHTLATQFMHRFQNVSLLAVTRGSRGCLWWTAEGAHGSHPGYRVRAVDTTGSGDGFVAGLLTGILKYGCAKHADGIANKELLSNLSDDTWNQIFTGANAVGAITSTRKGAIPALPTVEELEQFMAAYES
jgi:fructokinase